MVGTPTELWNAIAKALPGDVIVIKDGEWSDCPVILTCNGSAGKPIRIKSQTPGGAFFSGKSGLRLGGDYLVVEGLSFKNGMAFKNAVWEFKTGEKNANHCRITNCAIIDYNPPFRKQENYWVALYGKENRIDHCDFEGKTNLGVLMAVTLEDERSRENGHSIDSNFFGQRKPLGSNAGEIIRVGVSTHCQFNSNTKIFNNHFRHCDGETEIISIKSGGNVVRGNLFEECQGTVVLRHGNGNTIEGNFFMGNGKEGTGGVRIINERNWVVGNYFQRCRGEGFRSPLAIMNGVPNSPAHRYLPVRDAVVANNTFDGCGTFSIGEGADPERSESPKQVFFFNNLFANDGRDTILLEVLSNADSVFCHGNVIEPSYNKPSIKGFRSGFIVRDDKNGLVKAEDNGANYLEFIPHQMAAEEKSRLQIGLSNKSGCPDLAYFKSITYFATKTKGRYSLLGTDWPSKKPSGTAIRNKKMVCPDADAVYAALAMPINNLTIELSGDRYLFDRPLIVGNNNISFTQKNNGAVRFASRASLAALFTMSGGGALRLSNLNITANDLNTGHFVLMDSSGLCVHAKFTMEGSTFSGLSSTAFFKALKTAYSDSVSIRHCTFNDNRADLLDLSSENDNKGFYNTEHLIFCDNKVNRNKGKLLSLLRGGNDESTMGPKLLFSNNQFFDCQTDGWLIDLFGTQRSQFNNNRFENCNPQGELIRYKDNVQARHRYRNNELVNSGTIEKDKFVAE